MKENENVNVDSVDIQIRVMADDKYLISKIIQQIQKLFPDSIFTGIRVNTLRLEGYKYRGYLIVKLKKEVKK